MSAPTPTAGLEMFAALLRLEQLVLAAPTRAEVRFIIANETRQLLPYTQSTLLVGRADESLRVETMGSISEVDRTAPMVAWLEQLASHWAAQPANAAAQISALTPEAMTADLRRAWPDFAGPQLLWVPLAAREGARQGVLLLGREAACTPAELALVSHLARIYGAALERFGTRRRWNWKQPRTRVIAAGVALGVVGAALAPVRMSVLAPAEVTARDAVVVSAPLDAVVSRVRVLPNQTVSAGDVLAELESTDLLGMQEIAARSLDVAQAELRRTQQAAFVDPTRKGDLAQLQAQVDLKRREYQLAQSRQQKATLQADRAGVAVVDDPQSWRGRPVRVGERILSIADPNRVDVTVMVPLRDAIVLEPGNAVKLFLDTDPLHSLPGRVQYVVYEPSMAGEFPAYKVRVLLDEGIAPPRIGLRGTARILGQQTTLFYYLLRRPITAARQWLGW